MLGKRLQLSNWELPTWSFFVEISHIFLSMLGLNEIQCRHFQKISMSTTGVNLGQKPFVSDSLFIKYLIQRQGSREYCIYTIYLHLRKTFVFDTHRHEKHKN